MKITRISCMTACSGWLMRPCGSVDPRPRRPTITSSRPWPTPVFCLTRGTMAQPAERSFANFRVSEYSETVDLCLVYAKA